jgi:hypothetical protein
MLVAGLLAGTIVVRLTDRNSFESFEQFYAIVVLVSIGIELLVFGFVPHMFFSDYIAQGIGWPTGNPFQLEVGMHDGCWGILGLLSYKYRRGFIQATVIGTSIFLIMAGANHLWEAILRGNYSPYNAQYIIGDWLPAAVYLFLAMKYQRLLSEKHQGRKPLP